MERVEDVLLHQKLLARAKDPDNRPVFHIRFLEVNVLYYSIPIFIPSYWFNWIKKNLDLSGK